VEEITLPLVELCSFPDGLVEAAAHQLRAALNDGGMKRPPLRACTCLFKAGTTSRKAVPQERGEVSHTPEGLYQAPARPYSLIQGIQAQKPQGAV